MEYCKANCKHCGKEFVKRTYNQVYCSDECVMLQRVKDKNSRNFNTDRAKYIIFQRDKFKCIYCGKSSIEDGVILHVDHIMPYILSKNNSIHNLVTACDMCNLTKGANKLEEDVYYRIINVIAERNKQLGYVDIEFVDKVLYEYFENMKNGNNSNK